MSTIPIKSIDDPRVLPYRDLPRPKRSRDSNLFIAEGRFLVERLLESRFAVHSVLVDAKYHAALVAHVPHEVPLYVVESDLAEQILGFRFHRGVLACGRRRARLNLSDVQLNCENHTIVACVAIQDPENLGGVLRNCAAFGVDAVLLSSNCADAFSRRVLRVSMGANLKLPLVESAHLEADLSWLRETKGTQVIATVLEQTAEPLEKASRSRRLALLLGNEAHGIEAKYQHLFQRRVTIPMQLDTDSLNVAVASGIFLYHFTRVEKAV